MLDVIVTGIVAVPAIRLAANIATWCFKSGAAAERNRQREIYASTRAQLAAERSSQWEIERKTRRRIAEERDAAHQAHYEMLGDLWDKAQEMRNQSREILKQFQDIRDQNQNFLQSLALTPEQRAAIHECNDQLERGIQRLRAYLGPYLKQFRDDIHDAQIALKSHEFVTPNLPAPTLPENFPFSGELLEFHSKELRNYPLVDLGHGQRGRFITPTLKKLRPPDQLRGLIQRYDKDRGFWLLSAAGGELASALLNGEAYSVPRLVALAEWRSDYRVAWWEHSSGERVMIRLDAGGLSQRIRRAPWGTPLHVCIHAADFFLRRIRGGEHVAREHRFSNWKIPCEASDVFWKAYQNAEQFSDKILIRESGMEGDPPGEAFILRLATGHEYPIKVSSSASSVRILPQCGARLGLVQQGNRKLLIFLLRGKLTKDRRGKASACELHQAIQESFEEQRDLLRLDQADLLELKKYKAVLQAEFETARCLKQETVAFSDWRIPDEQQRGHLIVTFLTTGKLSESCAVRLSGEQEIIGWSESSGEEKNSVNVSILFEKRNVFRNDGFAHEGKLEAVPVGRELQNKIDAIENFLSAAATERKSSEEKAAFSRLRRELLGNFSADENGESPLMSRTGSTVLDEHQERAVGLISGQAPLVLIQGPPGTGKTHVIAHAINRILTGNQKARIAITSQANPAVDEAIAKIQDSFPSLQIYRDYSAAAKEKYSMLDRGVGLDQYYSDFIKDIEGAPPNDDPKAAYIQQWLKNAIRSDPGQFERDMHRILSQRSQVVACTLSRLAAISASAPSFDLVIVDEAAKASVPEAMIAANCAKRLALVGDHHQLLPYLDESFYEHSAPTGHDRKMLKELWNDSLFSRLWRQAPASRKTFLATMRRSRRPIAECISSCFYDMALIPGRNHDSPATRYPMSLVWLDSTDSRHSPAGQTTIKNPAEVSLVVRSLEEIQQLTVPSVSVTVIAFHRGQAELLNRKIRESGLQLKPSVLTVDASQGGQWDIVILSLARTHGSSGFVGNPNRLNVAISRAKEICIIVGSMSYAQRDATPDSRLRDVCQFMTSQPKTGKWICRPRDFQSIPRGFGFPPERRNVQ